MARTKKVELIATKVKDTQQMLQEIEIKLGCRIKIGKYTQDIFDPTDKGEIILEDFVTPISLSRILSVLGKEGSYNSGTIGFWIGDNLFFISRKKLLNDDNSDAMLSDQSPITIKAIWEIVCK